MKLPGRNLLYSPSSMELKGQRGPTIREVLGETSSLTPVSFGGARSPNCDVVSSENVLETLGKILPNEFLSCSGVSRPS